jgi:transcriptional regulator with XRE-family HTH domain
MLRLTRERLRRGLTQKQASARTKIGYSSYYKIEQGVHVPSKTSPTARKLERFFGYKLSTLLRNT